ncbi:MAG: hypothetical protein AAFV88_07730 [Planctomycetota bacterium]
MLNGRAAGIWIAIGALCLSGCLAESTEQPTATRDSIEQPSLPAADYLRQILTRYQSAGSYRDEGVVRLGIERDGKSSVQVAPMHVQFYRSSLWVAAYDARIWTDGSKTIGWLADPESEMHDGQIVVGGRVSSKEAGARPELKRLLGDPLLATRMTSGLGGPPPQLEWLFDSEPMAKLFRGDSEQATRTVRYSQPVKRDGVPCIVIETVSGDESYRFYIDQPRSIVIAIDLPISLAGQEVRLDGWRVRSLELVLENATFEPPDVSLTLSAMPGAKLPRSRKFVGSLIPLPPPPPSPRVGSVLDPFTGQDLTNPIRVNQRGVDRQLTIWYAAPEFDGSNNESLVSTLQAMNSIAIASANQRGSDVVRRVAVGPPESLRRLNQNGARESGWLLVPDPGQSIRSKLGIEDETYALTATNARVYWLGDPSVVGDLASLGSIIQDTLSGVDVPKRLRERWETDRRAYEAKLQELRAPFPGRL